jgi:hypothetical protein
MPFTRSGLWVPRDLKPTRRGLVTGTALISVLSALVSIGALYVSYKSLQASNQATVLSQRAYLSITDSKFTFKNSGLVKDMPSGLNSFTATISFSLQNLGNTPAKIVSSETRLYYPDDDFEDSGTVHERDFPFLKNNKRIDQHAAPQQELGPKASRLYSFSVLLIPTAKAWRNGEYRAAPQAYSDEASHDWKAKMEKPLLLDETRVKVVAVGDITYEDVFSQTHPLHFCWYLSQYDSIRQLRDCVKDQAYQIDFPPMKYAQMPPS